MKLSLNVNSAKRGIRKLAKAKQQLSNFPALWALFLIIITISIALVCKLAFLLKPSSLVASKQLANKLLCLNDFPGYLSVFS